MHTYMAQSTGDRGYTMFVFLNKTVVSSQARSARNEMKYLFYGVYLKKLTVQGTFYGGKEIYSKKTQS
eukprot:gene434-778_t